MFLPYCIYFYGSSNHSVVRNARGIKNLRIRDVVTEILPRNYKVNLAFIFSIGVIPSLKPSFLKESIGDKKIVC